MYNFFGGLYLGLTIKSAEFVGGPYLVHEINTDVDAGTDRIYIYIYIYICMCIKAANRLSDSIIFFKKKALRRADLEGERRKSSLSFPAILIH